MANLRADGQTNRQESGGRIDSSSKGGKQGVQSHQLTRASLWMSQHNMTKSRIRRDMVNAAVVERKIAFLSPSRGTQKSSGRPVRLCGQIAAQDVATQSVFEQESAEAMVGVGPLHGRSSVWKRAVRHPEVIAECFRRPYICPTTSTISTTNTSSQAKIAKPVAAAAISLMIPILS
ncbi:hypothetical protein MSL71_48140 [Desulfoluna butyratoxydans]|uniref:Uncharacterized protein n=1 Tax=Desulfoluna butyratoxydans TaxID=231438 RepID=A0A4V6YUG0_9BACT|nr:hypothetical protein MSL71_48140 [Desulfoluna butyratoxydans]